MNDKKEDLAEERSEAASAMVPAPAQGPALELDLNGLEDQRLAELDEETLLRLLGSC